MGICATRGREGGEGGDVIGGIRDAGGGVWGKRGGGFFGWGGEKRKRGWFGRGAGGGSNLFFREVSTVRGEFLASRAIRMNGE